MSVTATLSEPHVDLTKVEPHVDRVDVDEAGVARVVVGATVLGGVEIEALGGLGDQLILTASAPALRRLATDILAALSPGQPA